MNDDPEMSISYGATPVYVGLLVKEEEVSVSKTSRREKG